MAEPLKRSAIPAPVSDDSAPRTARARSERDLGRNKRPPRGERSSSQKRSSGRPEARTAQERPRSDRSRPSRGGSGSPQRPRDVSAGSGARILAPLALVIFAIACFAVVTNQSSDGSVGDNSTTSSSTAKKAAAAGAAASTPTRATYKVKAGDSFAAIAEAQGVDVNTLQELNPDIDPRALQPGQKLKLR